MLLKRHYKRPEGWEPIKNNWIEFDYEGIPARRLQDPTKEEGAILNPPTELDYVEVKHTGTTPDQHFSRPLIEAAIAEGWATLSRGSLILHVQPEELIYSVKRMPGRYCCHCSDKLLDDATGEAARKHIVLSHSGLISPDPSNPSGYEMIDYYDCELMEEQHQLYRARGASSGKSNI